ncbi:MAG: ester cyclase [Chlamydiia bacterium]|nr:ester cyclase [Chlamydiia bacterium]
MRKILSLLLLACASLCANEIEQTATSIFTPQGADVVNDNKLIVQRYYKAFQENNTSELLKTLTPKYGVVNANAIYDSSFYLHPSMSKNQKVRCEAMHKAFPDLSLQIIELIAEKNRVFAYVAYSGTQKGPFLGIEPTGKPIQIRQFAIFSIQNNRIVHITEMDNEFSVMEQLGYVLLK